MPSGRALTELPAVLTSMGKACVEAELYTVRELTYVAGDIVDRQGRKFRLRSGNNGKKFPLEAKTDVKQYGTREGVLVVRGAVRGVPEGFWSIVMYGSYPHVITGRKDRQGKGRVTRTGREVSRAMTYGQVTRRLMKGQSLAKLQPVRTPYGPRQYVMHPGHGPIGKPWDLAMVEAGIRLPQVLDAAASRSLVRTFTTATGKQKSFRGRR